MILGTRRMFSCFKNKSFHRYRRPDFTHVFPEIGGAEIDDSDQKTKWSFWIKVMSEFSKILEMKS